MLKGGLIFCCWANGAKDNKFKAGEYYPIDEVIERDPVLDYDRDHWLLENLYPRSGLWCDDRRDSCNI